MAKTDVQLPSEYYNSKTPDRKNYEDRAKEIAKLTLPYVIREESDSGTTAMTDSNNQSYNGRLINTLKAKMGMALLPPATSSFRYVPKPEELLALTGGSKDNAAKVHALLSQNVSTVNAELELQQIRSSLFDIIVELLVVGSVLVEKKSGKKKGVRIHKLMSFVVDLDENGDPYKMCFVEKLNELPEGVTPKEEKDEYELYTMLELDYMLDMWVMTQEVDQEIVGDEITYKDNDDMPYKYLGWTWMTGDQYHRPYAEDYYKDMEQLDKLAKLLTDGAIIAAKSLIFVNERGGRTRKDQVADSQNGDVVDGVADDVTMFTTEKNFDFNFVSEREAKIQRQLAQAFLLNESATRDAERVTAEEIAFMARELESSSLAGIYSKLSQQWSKWIVNQVMRELGIKFESIEVEILTGLDALGRSQEAQKLDRLLQRAAQLNLTHWFNDDEVLTRYASFESVNTVGLLKTPAEVEAELQAQREAQAQQALADNAAASAGQVAGQSITQPAQS